MPSPPLPSTQAGPPRAFRSDTVGIFAVLLVVGVGHLVTPGHGSLDDLVPAPVSLLWTVTLVVFGAMGLVACLLPRQWLFLALGMEATARIALGFSTAAYAVAVAFARGVDGITRVATYSGISLLCFLAAFTILRWLRSQRRAVTIVLSEQTARHDRDDEARRRRDDGRA